MDADCLNMIFQNVGESFGYSVTHAHFTEEDNPPYIECCRHWLMEGLRNVA